MASIDYDKKINSKPYRFFDMVFRLIMVNIFTIVLSLTVICCYPAIVASYDCLKNTNQTSFIKQYFKSFAHYFKRSLLVGLVLTFLYIISGYALYFYYNSTSHVSFTNLFINAGFTINFIVFLLLIFLSVHFPLLIITFKSLSTWEIYKTSLYVTFKYFLTTFIMFLFNIIIIGGLIACLFIPQLLAIWMLCGISLPIFLGIKITYPVYYRFEKMDFEKIIHAGMEENDDE